MPNFTALDGNGMDVIPIELRQKDSDSVVSYILDLYRSEMSARNYKTKLMTVGYAEIGKTTFLSCLFPAEYDVEFTLQGKKGRFVRLSGDTLEVGNPLVSTLHLDREQSTISVNGFSASLTAKLSSVSESLVSIELSFGDLSSLERFTSRINDIQANSRTHGIDITRQVISNEVTKNKIGNAPLELSVWDFAGQEDYYQNHHHFLSNRTVFLVLWNISQGEKGLQGLEFWLNSLASRLSSGFSGDSSEVYFSILVVGTFLDHASVKREEKAARYAKIAELMKKLQLEFRMENYHEVSCKTGENLSVLKDALVKSALSHSKVPLTHIKIQEYITLKRAVLPGWHGSVSSQEDLAKENEDLAKENEDLRMKLAMLEPKDK